MVALVLAAAPPPSGFYHTARKRPPYYSMTVTFHTNLLIITPKCGTLPIGNVTPDDEHNADANLLNDYVHFFCKFLKTTNLNVFNLMAGHFNTVKLHFSESTLLI